jgi:hypothetical protein
LVVTCHVCKVIYVNPFTSPPTQHHNQHPRSTQPADLVASSLSSEMSAVMETHVTKGKEPEVNEANEVTYGEPGAKMYVQILYL